MWGRYEFWTALLVGALFAFVILLETFNEHSLFATVNSMPSPIVGSILGWSQFGDILFVLSPMLATLPCAWYYYHDSEENMVPILVSRLGRKGYYLGRVLAISVSAFIVSVFPYLLNLGFSFVAYRFSEYGLFVDHVYTSAAFFERVNDVLFPGLYMNKPLGFAFLIIVLYGLYGVLMAMLSYSITLYYRKNIAIAMATTTVISFGSVLLLQILDRDEWSLAPHFATHYDMYGKPNLANVVIIFSFLILVNVFLIGDKIVKDRDVIS